MGTTTRFYTSRWAPTSPGVQPTQAVPGLPTTGWTQRPMGHRGTRTHKERLKHRQRQQAQIRRGARGTRAQRQGTQRAPLTHFNGEHFVWLGWGNLRGTVLFMCYIKGCRRCAPDLSKMLCTLMYACSQYHSTICLLRHMKGRRCCVSLLDLSKLHS